MATNGRRRPPRPRIEIKQTTASPDEAVAIAGALEQFLVETAPAPQGGSGAVNRWQRAALREAVGARELEPGGGWGPSIGPC